MILPASRRERLSSNNLNEAETPRTFKGFGLFFILVTTNCDFEFQMVLVDNKPVGVIVIRSAMNQPVTFEKTEYIRIGSYTKK